MNDDIMSRLPPEISTAIMLKMDIISLIKVRGVCLLFYHLVDYCLQHKGAVPNYTLIISKADGSFYTGVYNNQAEKEKIELHKRSPDVFAPYKFAEIDLRVFNPDLHLDVIKRSAGACETLIFSGDHLSGDHIRKALDAVQPKRVLIRFGAHAIADVDAYKEFDGIKYLDVETPNIDRLTPRLLRLLREHHMVKLELSLFPLETFHHFLFQWEHGREFGQLRRLEVNGVSYSPFTYSTTELVQNRIRESLGTYTAAATEAFILVSPTNGLALLITTPLRMIFVPVEDREEAIAELVGEFALNHPMDASSLLEDRNPLEKIRSLQSASVPIDDDWDWD